MSSKILVVADHDGSKLNAGTARAVKAASTVPGAEVHVLVLAADGAAAAAAAGALDGVTKVLVANRAENAHALAAVSTDRECTTGSNRR